MLKRRPEMDNDKAPLGAPQLFIASLEWNPGPAAGGGGTAGFVNGVPWWWDGDTLLLVVETNGGTRVWLVTVHADEDQLSFLDPETGDDNFGYQDDSILWWAKINKALPPEKEDGAATTNPTEGHQ